MISTEDQMLIRALYSAYSDSVFQRNLDSWLSCWTEDGQWTVFGKEIRGTEALQKQWSETWSTIDKMAFFSEIGLIDVEDSCATVRSYCHEIVSLKNGSLFKVVAQYTDELEKFNGRWLFSKRVYSVLFKE